MQTVFFINPTAGSRNAAEELVPKIRAAARNTGVPVEIYETAYAGQAREMAEKYAASGQKVHLFACGGDGTLNEVLQGASGYANAAVGCVPCGSGNDYVRNFGTAADFLDIEAQLQAKEVQSDLIRSTQGCGIDIFAAGIDAQVANGIPKWRRVPFCGGSTAYTLSILEAVCSSFRNRLRIRADHIDIEGTFMMMAVCNGQQYGGYQQQQQNYSENRQEPRYSRNSGSSNRSGYNSHSSGRASSPNRGGYASNSGNSNGSYPSKSRRLTSRVIPSSIDLLTQKIVIVSFSSSRVAIESR